ncbi:MAG: iron-containing alcohol dehydrogenase [Anaerolineales bacterium]
MWYFSSPNIVFGEGALSHLEKLQGRRACIVSDENLLQSGFVEQVRSFLPSDIAVQIFTGVEPDPSLETIRQGAMFLQQYQPDWIIAVGGGSVLDAAKGMWILYECPDVDPSAINPIETYGLRRKARFVAIPTTAGTGSETTWAIVLRDTAERRKLALGSREVIPDWAILDPEMILKLPPRLTADTGLDALTHAIEGFTSTFHNDFTDGLCLHAVRLIFEYLPRCYQNGSDFEARQHMQNAAAIAGLGFGNSMAALAHGLGHSLGAVFRVPHGRAVALFLPYTIEYCAGGDPQMLRYVELVRALGLPGETQNAAAHSLAHAIRDLEKALEQPLNLQELGISREALEREMDLLVANALNDTQTIMSVRVPDENDLQRLFCSAFEGKLVDF